MKRACVMVLAAVLASPVLGQPGGPGGPEGPGGPPQRGPREGERGPQGGPPAEAAMIRVGYLGLAAEPVSPELATQLGLARGVGLTVVSVKADSPAAAAGVQQHDVLHKLDDQVLVNTAQLRTLVQNHAEGDTVTLTLIRQAQPVTVTATVGATEVPERGLGGPPPWAGRAAGPWGPGGLEGPGGPGGPGGLGGPDRDGRGEWEDRGPRRDAEGPHGPQERGDGQLQQRQRIDSTISRSSVGAATFKDDEHELRVTMTDGQKTLVAKDAAGQELFNGPINSPEERAAVPDAIRVKLDKLEATRPPQFRPRAPSSDPGQQPL